MKQNPEAPRLPTKLAELAYAAVYTSITLLFAVCGASLVVFSALELWRGVIAAGSAAITSRFEAVLESVGMLTIAVAALELGQTVWEEEVQRRALMSAPTRVRRFISRFLVVVVVALAIEALTAAFRFAHDKPEGLPYVRDVAFGASALLIAWGVFVHLNRGVEALEPEGMERAKREDAKLDSSESEP